MNIMKNRFALAVLCTLSIIFFLSGCSGRNDDDIGPTFGGNVSGLNAGNTVVLHRHSENPAWWAYYEPTDAITISGNGTYSFAKKAKSGESAYFVAVVTQPGDQFCSIANMYGSLGNADITNINLSCGNKVTAAASMSVPRSGHTATLLANGKVLVAGGDTLATYELYDPATDSWAAARNLPGSLSGHTANLLQNGKVLVTGDSGAGSISLLYDPASDAWTTTLTPMATARSGHVSVVLADGRVLVAGGASISSAEIYDPVTGVWSSAGSLTLNTANTVKSATLLANGKVLVTKGQLITGSGLGAAEIYDPASNSWTQTSSAPNFANSAFALPNGTVLVTTSASATSFALIYDPLTDSWSNFTSAKGFDPATGRVFYPYNAGEILLSSPDTLMVTQATIGGSEQYYFTYNFTENIWYQGQQVTARSNYAATALPNGRVLISGGIIGSAVSNLAELY